MIFASNYDLKEAPNTVITEDVSGNYIPVKSTSGFPEKKDYLRGMR